MAIKVNKKLSFYVSFIGDDNHSVSVNTSTAAVISTDTVGYSNAYSVSVNKNTNTSIVTVTFNANSGYYYSSPPKAIISSPNKGNYNIQESSVKGGNNEIIAKTFVVNYRGVVTNANQLDKILFKHVLSISSITLDTNVGLKEIQGLKDSLYYSSGAQTSIIKSAIASAEANLKTNVESNLIEVEQEKQKAAVLQITKYGINTSDISSAGETRIIRVFGTPGASYNLTISKCTGTIPCTAPDTFYDPGTAAFTSGGKGWYNETISEGGFSALSISFPSTDEINTYVFKITPNNSLYFILGSGPNGELGEFHINQQPPITATFSLASNDSSGSYNTLPSNVTMSRDNNEEGGILNINWNVSLSANSFTLLRQPLLTDFYITTTVNTDDINDKHAGTKVITLDSVDNVFVGALVTGSSPFSTSGGTQYITHVDRSNKEITVTSTQDLNDNQTLTFTGYGATGIQGISGTRVSLLRDLKTVSNIEPVASLRKVTTTTDTTVSGTTINVASTNGIKAKVTNTVSGNHSAVTVIALGSGFADSIGIGHRIVAVSSGSLDGFPEVLEVGIIGSTENAIRVSIPQTFANGITLSFAKTTMAGPGVSAPTDDTLTASSPLPYVTAVSAGVSVTVTNSQTLENGVELEFEGSSRNANIQFQLDVAKLGTSSFTATLELDNFLAVS